MTIKTLKEIQLSDRPQITLHDESRKMAGNRWLVRLRVRMAIDVDEALAGSSLSTEESAERRARLGATVAFEHIRERVFVAAAQKKTLLERFCREFEANLLPYLLRADFPRKFVEKQYREALKRAAIPQR